MSKKKGIKISSVKRQNHMVNKLSNKGKHKSKKKPLKFYGLKPKNALPETELDEGREETSGKQMLEMMEHEDVEFLENAVTSRSYHILRMLRAPSERENRKRGHGNREIGNGNDKLERQYERELNLLDVKRTKILLPIKTKEGLVMQSTEIGAEEEEKQILQRENKEKEKEEERKRRKQEKNMRKKAKRESEREAMKEDEDKDEDEEEKEIKIKEEEVDDLEMLEKEFQSASEPVAAVDLMACREHIIRKKKFQIGLLSASLLEAPEMKVRNFKYLLEILSTEHSEVKLTVRKLAALSLLEVFKDLLPAYLIRPQEEKQGVKLKKTTVQLRNYEIALLKAYKMYLKNLEKMSNNLRRKRGDKRHVDEKSLRLGVVGVRCMAELLMRHPYFNFSPNIAQALVSFLDNNYPAARELALNGLRTVLKEDKRGDLTLHIVRRIKQMVHKKNHDVRPEALQVLLALRLREINLDAEKEAELKEKQNIARKNRLLHPSKRERRRMKRLQEVEREMLETKAEENKQTKQKHLTEVTKNVFTIFFRVLKRAPSSKLLSITLEGLAKFAHCINLEFFQDLVNVLDHLLQNENLGLVEQLHCVETVFTILSGQGEALNIDPMRFYSHLYRCLPEVNGGRTNADAMIVLRSLEKAVLARRRKVSLQRLMAFIKRLCTLAPHMLHDAAMGYLAIIQNVLLQSPACDVLLDTDASHGDGIYQPEMQEPEYCGAGTSVLWELTLLKRHYHPDVRRISQSIMNGDESNLPLEIAKYGPSKLAEVYDCSRMVFRPAIPVPKNASPKAYRGRLVLTSDEFDSYLQNIEKTVNFNALQKWKIPGLDDHM